VEEPEDPAAARRRRQEEELYALPDNIKVTAAPSSPACRCCCAAAAPLRVVWGWVAAWALCCQLVRVMLPTCSAGVRSSLALDWSVIPNWHVVLIHGFQLTWCGWLEGIIIRGHHFR
jgi:hypothetical protein